MLQKKPVRALNLNHIIFKLGMEDPVGFEPTIRELQSLALPLGYGSNAGVNSGREDRI